MQASSTRESLKGEWGVGGREENRNHKRLASSTTGTAAKYAKQSKKKRPFVQPMHTVKAKTERERVEV